MDVRKALHDVLQLVLVAVLLGAPVQSALAGEPVVIGERFKIESKALNETRSYVVHKPSNYEFSQDRYSVIILIDGETHIPMVSAVSDFLSNTGRTMPMLVVGIDNTDRQRDLTPPLHNAKPDFVPEGKIGGAPQFLSFIADELIPHLDRTYRTRPTRILIGFSYGGLFTVYTLLNRPDVFRAYIAASPSLGWDDQSLSLQADAFAAAHPKLDSAIYMTVANEGDPMLGGALKLVGALNSHRGSMAAEFHHWPEESHSSTNMRTVNEGLKWLSESYYIHDPFRTYEEAGLEFFDRRFRRISDYLGYEVKIPEGYLTRIQGILIELKRPVEAERVTQRIAELYPGNAGVYVGLGKMYVDAGDNDRAIEKFKHALQLCPGDTKVRTQLEKLGVNTLSLIPEAKPRASVLRSYVGEYRAGDEINWISLKSGTLSIKSGSDTHELRALSDTKFYAVDADREYTFKPDAKGRVTGITVHLPNADYESSKIK